MFHRQFLYRHGMIFSLCLFGLYSCRTTKENSSRALIFQGESLAADNPGHFNTVGLTPKRPGSNSPEFPRCSGVVYAPGKILTAGHCAQNAINNQYHFVEFENLSEGIQKFHLPIVGAKVHPLYKENKRYQVGGVADVGVVFYDHPSVGANTFPRGFGPVPSIESLDDLTRIEGNALQLVGYGRTSPGPDTKQGWKLTTSVPIDKVWDDRYLGLDIITYSHEFKGSCPGDSGGPAYVKLDGGWKLAGVTTGGHSHYLGNASNCGEGKGVYVGVPLFTDWVKNVSRENDPTQKVFTEEPIAYPDLLSMCDAKQKSLEQWRSLLYGFIVVKQSQGVDPSTCEVLVEKLKTIDDLTLRGHVSELDSVDLLAAEMPQLAKISLTHSSPDKPSNTAKILDDVAKVRIDSVSSIIIYDEQFTSLQSILPYKNLTKLNISSPTTDSKGLERLSSLQELRLTGPFTSGFADGLAALSDLKTITIAGDNHAAEHLNILVKEHKANLESVTFRQTKKDLVPTLLSLEADLAQSKISMLTVSGASPSDTAQQQIAELVERLQEGGREIEITVR